MCPCHFQLKNHLFDKYCNANDLLRKPPGAYFQQPKSLLIMDSARAHTSKEATDALGVTNTTAEIIDGGMTPLLQFIDTHINKPFKDH